MSADIRSPLLELPVEIWDRILFWMSLSPLDVANFAKSSVRCYFLAFGPVTDRNEYNVLQHGALIGSRVIELDNEDRRYFKYINLYSGFPIDYALLAFLRMADRGQAVSCFETALDDESDIEDDLMYCLENTELGGRTKKLLRQLAEEFEPSDLRRGGRMLMHAFGALSGVTYGDGPPDEGVELAAKFAAVGGHPETLKSLLARGIGPRTGYVSLYNAFYRDSYDCFEVAMDHIVSKGPSPDTTYKLFKTFNWRPERVKEYHRYNMRIFKEIARRALPLALSHLKPFGSWARKMILRDENPTELMRLIVGSEATRRILEAGTVASLYENESKEILEVLELAIEVGHAVFDFTSFSEVFDAATRWGRHSMLARLVLQVELDLGSNSFERTRAYLPYAKWFGGRILIPLCEDHDWADLKREVADFAEGSSMEMLSVCYQEVSRRIPGSRDILGTDSGVASVRQVVAAFTPWLFGGGDSFWVFDWPCRWEMSPLLAAPVEVWDRVLFMFGLSPADVRAFLLSGRAAYRLVHGDAIGDLDKFNLLQHRALFGPDVALARLGSDGVDPALLALSRESDRDFNHGFARCARTIAKHIARGAEASKPRVRNFLARAKQQASYLAGGLSIPFLEKNRNKSVYGPLYAYLGDLDALLDGKSQVPTDKLVVKCAAAGGSLNVLDAMGEKRGAYYLALEVAARKADYPTFEHLANKKLGLADVCVKNIVKAALSSGALDIAGLMLDCSSPGYFISRYGFIQAIGPDNFKEAAQVIRETNVVVKDETFVQVFWQNAHHPCKSSDGGHPMVNCAVLAGIPLPRFDFQSGLSAAVKVQDSESIHRIIFRSELDPTSRWSFLKAVERAVLWPRVEAADWDGLRHEVDYLLEDGRVEIDAEALMLAVVRTIVPDEGPRTSAVVRKVFEIFAPYIFAHF